jgi:hypothetical protein
LLLLSGVVLFFAIQAEPASSGLSPYPSGTSCPISQATSGTFTVFWISDTQHLSNYANLSSNWFTTTTQWIADRWSACNGVLLIHTGDIVDGWQDTRQWGYASQAMSVLLDNGLPYTWNAGNWDGGGTGSWIGNQYRAFDPNIVKNEPGWVDSTSSGMSTAVKFSAGGQNYLVINIQFDGTSDLDPWVSSLLSQYSNYRIIIATHGYMQETGTVPHRPFTDQLTSLMNSHPNVFLVMSGDNQAETTVHVKDPTGARWQLLFDRQESDDEYGAASVTTLTFDAAAGEIYVNTFDIYLGSLIDQYVLDISSSTTTTTGSSSTTAVSTTSTATSSTTTTTTSTSSSSSTISTTSTTSTGTGGRDGGGGWRIPCAC